MKFFIVLALAVATVNAASFKSAGKHAFTKGSINSLASYESTMNPAFLQGRNNNCFDAEKGEAPYIVSLFNVYNHYCSGVIIAENWVLTTSDCVPSWRPDATVIAGLHLRDDRYYLQVRPIERENVIYHEDYSSFASPNNIALIYIDEPFDFNALTCADAAPVDKIALPSDEFSQDEELIFYDWNPGTSKHFIPLQKRDAEILSFDICKSTIDPSDYGRFTSDMFCAVFHGISVDPCHTGNLGSPLVRYSNDGAELVGLLSDNEFDKFNSHKVFIKISAFKEWIEEKMSNHLAL